MHDTYGKEETVKALPRIIEYLQSEGSINKDDIKLYIDLNEVSLEDNTCKIKYESIYEIEKINIDPDTVTIEES